MTAAFYSWIDNIRVTYYNLTGANLVITVDDSTDVENYIIEVIKTGEYDEIITRFESEDEVKLFIMAMIKQARLDRR